MIKDFSLGRIFKTIISIWIGRVLRFFINMVGTVKWQLPFIPEPKYLGCTPSHRWITQLNLSAFIK